MSVPQAKTFQILHFEKGVGGRWVPTPPLRMGSNNGGLRCSTNIERVSFQTSLGGRRDHRPNLSTRFLVTFGSLLKQKW